MWWSRRSLLLVLGAAAGCGFSPVYGPGGTDLSGQVYVPDPGTQAAFVLATRLRDRLGDAGPVAPYRVETRLTVDQQSLGATSAGETTRYRLAGRVAYTLTQTATDTVLLEDETYAFTGYSATGSTVATLAAERDARRRLSVILADQLADLLVLALAEPGT